MEKNILKVTKSDGSIHFVPNNSPNKAMYELHNSKMPNKVVVEEITTDEMNELITAGSLVNQTLAKKKEDLVSENALKDKRIAELEAQLAASKKEDAKVVIEKINAAQTADEVKVLIEGENRKSVTDAAAKRIAELEAQPQ